MRNEICDDRYAKLKGFEVRHLNLDADDHAEMIRAYKADDSAFHKADLKHMYAVATGDDKDMLPLLKGQITPWLGKQLFAIAPPGCTEPLLYTPAPASIKRWGDPAVLSADEKLNRVLVSLVPKDARIKMTVLQNITAHGDTEAMDDKQYGGALHRSLTHELMAICHAVQLRANAIAVGLRSAKSRFLENTVADRPEIWWLCSLRGTAPLRRGPGRGKVVCPSRISRAAVLGTSKQAWHWLTCFTYASP